MPHCIFKTTIYSTIELKQTETFRKWWTHLKDGRAVTAIFSRLGRLSYGLAGDAKPVGEGISKLRIHHGPGYRVYYKRHGNTLIILLCGGDKSTQNNDIKLAKKLAKEWSDLP